MMTIETSPHFWDCECLQEFIHAKVNRLQCPVCKMWERDGMPDSRVHEIKQGSYFHSRLDEIVAQEIYGVRALGGA